MMLTCQVISDPYSIASYLAEFIVFLRLPFLNFLRCGWSKSNLCVALDSLLSACATHRAAFSVPDFGGLGVVLRNDPSVLHQGMRVVSGLGVK